MNLGLKVYRGFEWCLRLRVQGLESGVKDLVFGDFGLPIQDSETYWKLKVQGLRVERLRIRVKRIEVRI